jgi:hypothetical protein
VQLFVYVIGVELGPLAPVSTGTAEAKLSVTCASDPLLFSHAQLPRRRFATSSTSSVNTLSLVSPCTEVL